MLASSAGREYVLKAGTATVPNGPDPAHKALYAWCEPHLADPAQFADNAFYCPQDDTIAYSEDLLGQLAQAGGPHLPVVVLEHEEGHRADRLGNHVGAISRSEENQADCDAGASTRFARNARRLPLTDVFNSATLLYQLGDRQAFGRERASDPVPAELPINASSRSPAAICRACPPAFGWAGHKPGSSSDAPRLADQGLRYAAATPG